MKAKEIDFLTDMLAMEDWYEKKFESLMSKSDPQTRRMLKKHFKSVGDPLVACIREQPNVSEVKALTIWDDEEDPLAQSDAIKLLLTEVFHHSIGGVSSVHVTELERFAIFSLLYQGFQKKCIAQDNQKTGKELWKHVSRVFHNTIRDNKSLNGGKSVPSRKGGTSFKNDPKISKLLKSLSSTDSTKIANQYRAEIKTRVEQLEKEENSEMKKELQLTMKAKLSKFEAELKEKKEAFLDWLTSHHRNKHFD